MSDDRRPLWPWIVALLIGLPVLYVLSLGPVARMTYYVDPNGWAFKFCNTYLYLANRACAYSEFADMTVGRYGRLWTPDVPP